MILIGTAPLFANLFIYLYNNICKKEICKLMANVFVINFATFSLLLLLLRR